MEKKEEKHTKSMTSGSTKMGGANEATRDCNDNAMVVQGVVLGETSRQSFGRVKDMACTRSA